MNMIDIIEKKKQKQTLTDEEIGFFVNGYTLGEIADYQVSALLMAICLNGMEQQEIFALTKYMAASGTHLDLSSIEGIKADKHSSGGVGDKTTPIVAAVVGACGVKMAKMSGKGLGFTGGTADKLLSFTGFRNDYSIPDMINIVKKVGVCLGGQTETLAPADKKLYALRDVTGTVDSIPLIASSIMSKKLVSGADVLILDVKTGDGALMKSVEEAILLADLMVDIGNQAGIQTCAVVTDMNEPLGHAVGNALEMREVIQILKNQENDDRLYQLCILLSAWILFLSGKVSKPEEGEEMARETISSGKALAKFYEIIDAQGGDIRMIDDDSLFPHTIYQKDIISQTNGYVMRIECEKIGRMSVLCGAGRMRKDDKIDYGSGIVLHKKCMDFVSAGEKLATIYTNYGDRLTEIEQGVASAYHIGQRVPETKPLVYRTITKQA